MLLDRRMGIYPQVRHYNNIPITYNPNDTTPLLEDKTKITQSVGRPNKQSIYGGIRTDFSIGRILY